MPPVPEEFLPILAKFHREVLLPDIQRIVSDAVSSSTQQLRDEMQTGFDGLAQRLDRLETEYQMLVAGLKRIEERLERVEHKLDRVALKSDLLALKARVDELERRLNELDAS